MQTTKNEEKRKRVYEKPRLRTIELAAEEVLAVGCKLTTGSPPAPYVADSCGLSNNCSVAGS